MNQKNPNAPSDAMELPASFRLRLRAALFLCGAAVMVLEILGTRIIGPHFGVGLFVWTALITVTLLALALGYWLGGILADRRPSLRALGGVLLAAAASVALIPLWRGPALDYSWTLGLRGGCLFAATILFLPPLLLLGMASPFAVRLEAAGPGRAGRSAGLLFAISTAGSVLGALLAGFVLVPSFRVPIILAVVAGTLVVAAILAAGPGLNGRLFVAGAVIALGGIGLAWPRMRPPELAAARTSAGTDLRVVDHEGSRHLFVDQTVQTTIDVAGKSKDQYAYFLAARILLARPETKTAALIGLGGGGIVPLLSREGIELDGVDLSPDVIEFARTHFGMTLPASRVHAADGRVFLKQRPARFDVIVLDVFTGDRIAFSLVSLEGLKTARDALTSGGLLALNTWGIDEEHGRPNQVGAAIRATLKVVFREVLAVPASGNLLFFASDNPIVPQRNSVVLPAFDRTRTFTWIEVPPTTWPEAPVLTDDWNPVDVLDATALEVLRVRQRSRFPYRIQAALSWE